VSVDVSWVDERHEQKQFVADTGQWITCLAIQLNREVPMKRLLIALISIVAAAPAIAEGRSCTRNSFGVFEDISCAFNARNAADKELNETYQRLLGVLRPIEAQALRKAQRAWLSYVDADAKFSFAIEGDGSSGRLVVANTRERLTRERIEALKSWLPR
jgi:uncharacterized protein YecT (DUF1311 family)